jgi:predicted  nucleic acid-binding Zn-ribbon protein
MVASINRTNSCFVDLFATVEKMEKEVAGTREELKGVREREKGKWSRIHVFCS